MMPKLRAVPPPNAEPLTDRAYRQLRLEIVECRLGPGQRLTEASVAERLQVGKMPVREALRRLVQEGLVSVAPRHGYAVAPVTLGDIRELFDLRLVLEPAAAERAAGRLDSDQQAQLRKLCEVSYRVTERESVRRYLKANTEFHRLIAESAGNRRIAQMVALLLAESERLINFIIPAHPEGAATVREHRQLFRALVSGDAPLARRLAAQHIRSTRSMVIEHLGSTPQFERVAIGA